MATDDNKKAAYPSWETPGMSPARFKKELRAWFDAQPDDPNAGPDWAKQEWAYICSLEGIEP